MHNPLMSQEGRALMGKLQQLPPDQHQQYLSSQIGMIPFGELVAIKQQMDALKNSAPPAQAPQTTVAQDLLQQIQQAKSAQPQMPPQQPQMPPQQPRMPPQEQGIAGLPANVGSEKAYASGGIVAFEDGGGVKHFAEGGRWDAEDEANYQRYAALQSAGYGITPYSGTYQTPEMRRAQEITDPEYKKLSERRKAAADAKKASTKESQAQGILSQYNIIPPAGAYGDRGNMYGERSTNDLSVPNASNQGTDPFGFGDLPKQSGKASASASTSFRSPLKGAAPDTWKNPVKVQTPEEYQAAVEEEANKAGVGNAAKAQRAALEGREKENESGKKKSGWDAFSEAGFRMAEAASKPNATFLGSMAAGGTEGVKAYREATKDAKATAAKLQDARFALDSAEEQFKYSQNEKARERLDKAQTKFESAQLKHEDNINDLDKIRLQNSAHIEAAHIQANAASAGSDRYAEALRLAEMRSRIAGEQDPVKKAAMQKYYNEYNANVALSNRASAGYQSTTLTNQQRAQQNNNAMRLKAHDALSLDPKFRKASPQEQEAMIRNYVNSGAVAGDAVFSQADAILGE